MDRATYDFTKKAARTAYQQAINDVGGGGGGTEPEPELPVGTEWTAGVYPTKDGEHRFYRKTSGNLTITFAKLPEMGWAIGKLYSFTHSKLGDLGTHSVVKVETSGNDLRISITDQPSWGLEGNGVFEVGTTLLVAEVTDATRRIRHLERGFAELLMRG
jgi:hypothetical protein